MDISKNFQRSSDLKKQFKSIFLENIMDILGLFSRKPLARYRQKKYFQGTSKFQIQNSLLRKKHFQKIYNFISLLRIVDYFF